MPGVSDRVRKRMAELGRLSRPLDEARAIEWASSLARMLTHELSANGDPDRIMRIYEGRLFSDVERAAVDAQDPDCGRGRGYKPLRDVLDRFSAADLFVCG